MPSASSICAYSPHPRLKIICNYCIIDNEHTLLCTLCTTTQNVTAVLLAQAALIATRQPGNAIASQMWRARGVIGVPLIIIILAVGLAVFHATAAQKEQIAVNVIVVQESALAALELQDSYATSASQGSLASQVQDVKVRTCI